MSDIYRAKEDSYMSLIQGKQIDKLQDLAATIADHGELASGLAIKNYVQSELGAIDLSTLQAKDVGAVNDNLAVFLAEETVDSGVALSDIALQTDLPDITVKQSKDVGAIDGNIAEFLSEQTIDSGIGVTDLVLYSDLHQANSVWANSTSSSSVFTDFQVTTNSVLGRAGSNIENIEVKVEQVVGRFLGDLTALDQTEVNDGGHSSTRNNVNNLLHWTVGTRYRSWDDVTIGTSLTDESVLGSDYFSGSGVLPNNGTTFFFPAGSLKEGMNIKMKVYQTVGATDTVTLSVRYNLINIGSITLTANENHMTEIDFVVTNISETAGGMKALYSDSFDNADDGSSSTLDTVNDATIDLVVTTGATTGTTIKMSEIIIAG